MGHLLSKEDNYNWVTSLLPSSFLYGHWNICNNICYSHFLQFLCWWAMEMMKLQYFMRFIQFLVSVNQQSWCLFWHIRQSGSKNLGWINCWDTNNAHLWFHNRASKCNGLMTQQPSDPNGFWSHIGIWIGHACYVLIIYIYICFFCLPLLISALFFSNWIKLSLNLYEPLLWEVYLCHKSVPWPQKPSDRP